MDATEYIATRRRLDAEYERAADEYHAVLAEYRQNVEALERVWWLTHPNGDELPNLLDEPNGSGGEISKAVAEAVKAMTGPFTWHDLRAYLAESHPDLEFTRPQINQVLRRMIEERTVEIVLQGAGRRATIYCKAETQEMSEPTS